MNEPFKTYVTLATSLLLVIAVVIGAGTFLKSARDDAKIKGSDANIVNTITQSTSTVSTTRVKLLDADSGRQYTRIDLDRDQATSTVFVYLTSASTSVIHSGGIPLNASSTPYFEITDKNLYMGEVWAITATGGARVHVTTN